MKRMGAALVGLVLLILTTALGTFTASAAPVSREQAVQFVIARGLPSAVCPTWGGGDINGPTMGKPETAPADAVAAPRHRPIWSGDRAGRPGRCGRSGSSCRRLRRLRD